MEYYEISEFMHKNRPPSLTILVKDSPVILKTCKRHDWQRINFVGKKKIGHILHLLF